MGERKREYEWHVVVLRNHGEYLGTVQGRDRKTAERAAVKLFKIDASRLLLRKLATRKRAG